jgi:nucleoside-diphosphate-sugar epimerase
MTEETPFNPNSKKGEVRARIATLLLEEIKAKNIVAMIVRSADFYGPSVKQSITYPTVIERLKKGKTAQWIGDPKTVHSFTYTPDAARTVAMLANNETAYNQTWHAITSKERITGIDYVRMACEAAGVKYTGVRNLRTGALKILGLFVPVLGELVEMMYQFEHDYLFDSKKAETTLQIEATTYRSGIQRTLDAEGSEQ